MSIFTILRQPVAISVTIFIILIKVTNDRFIFLHSKDKQIFSKTDDAIRTEITPVSHPLIISQDLLYTVLNIQCSFILTMEGSLVDRTDLPALYLSGTYCHKTSTRPPSCQTPRQPTI